MLKDFWIKFSGGFGETIIHPQFIYNRYRKEIIAAAQKYSRGDLIDIGCGRMEYKEYLKEHIKSYTGIDSPKTVKLYLSKNKADILAPVEKLPIKDSQYDTALFIQVMEYVDDPQKSLNEISRILKKGGILILSSPFMYSIHDIPYDRNRFTSYALVDFIKKANLKVVEVKSQGTFSDFIFLSILVCLFKNLKLQLHKKSLSAKLFSGLFGIIAISLIIPLNILCIIFNLISQLFPKYPNIFTVNYLIIARK